jgi:nicotinamide-nucleotide amidase
LNSPFSIIQYEPTVEFDVGQLLRKNKHRIAVLEATTGGLISASLLSVPGASAFFISCAVVYTGRGAKRILPEDVLRASSLFDREKNYVNREAYVSSKIKYCQVVSQAMRTSMKADFAIVESGTTGPDFYIPGVKAFTAVGIAGPNGLSVVKVFDSETKDRSRNMMDFCDFGLVTLRDALEHYYSSRAILDSKPVVENPSNNDVEGPSKL